MIISTRVNLNVSYVQSRDLLDPGWLGLLLLCYVERHIYSAAMICSATIISGLSKPIAQILAALMKLLRLTSMPAYFSSRLFMIVKACCFAVNGMLGSMLVISCSMR